MSDPSDPQQHLRAHHIVALETQFCSIPEFDLRPCSYTLKSYPKTLRSQISERIHDASIIITTTIRLDATSLSAEVCPNLRVIAVMATGVDSIDLDACRKRGITVLNCAGANVIAVSEHVIGMYFAVRRRFVQTQAAVRSGLWSAKGTLIPMLQDQAGKMPLTCREETMGLIGYGAIGKKIEGLAKALGFRVVVADRKNASSVRAGRVTFEDCLRLSTVIVIVIPRTPETIGLISRVELAKMSASTVLINASRGDIVDEAAVVAAVRTGAIAGVAFDVFSQEPADSNTSPLLAPQNQDLNILTTPHTAWLANTTMTSLQRIVKEGLEGWFQGHPMNVVT